MAEKLTICLIGPKKSGKSALLASAPDCIVQGAHGYSPDLQPAMQPIGRGEFDAVAAVAAKLGLLEDSAEEFQKLRRAFAESDAPHEQLFPVEHFFRLTLNGAQRAGPCLLKIVDASGDIAVTDEAAPTDVTKDAREKFAARLSESQAIVLAPPLLRVEESGWALGMARLIERLARAPGDKLKRIVVAFTQYDRLFTRLGPSAFTYACDPAVALYVLRKHLAASNWIAGLRALEAANVDVRFTVASSFGFAKKFQCPNVDPHQKGERRFRRASVSGPRALNEFWRPFLTADPFIFSATGLDSAFAFTCAQIDGTLEVRAPQLALEE